MAKRKGSGSGSLPEPDFLTVARVLRPWGVRGDVKIELLASHPDDLMGAKQVYLGEARTPFDVQSVRAHGGALLLKLAGCETPEQADAFRNQTIAIARADAAPLRANQYFHHQILGLNVFTVEGEPLGQIVEIIETGANDVYVVHGSRGEVLLPARAEIIRHIDLDAGQMTIALLPGLLPE